MLKNKIIHEQAAKPNKNLTMPAAPIKKLLDKLNELLTAVQTDELTTQPAAIFKEIRPILAGRINQVVLNKLEEIVAVIQPDYSTLELKDQYLCDNERMLIKIYKMFIDIMIKNKLVDEHAAKPNDKLEDDPPIEPVTEPATEPATVPAIESAAKPDDTPIYQTQESMKIQVRLVTIMTLCIAWFVMVAIVLVVLGLYLYRTRLSTEPATKPNDKPAGKPEETITKKPSGSASADEIQEIFATTLVITNTTIVIASVVLAAVVFTVLVRIAHQSHTRMKTLYEWHTNICNARNSNVYYVRTGARSKSNDGRRTESTRKKSHGRRQSIQGQERSPQDVRPRGGGSAQSSRRARLHGQGDHEVHHGRVQRLGDDGAATERMSCRPKRRPPCCPKPRRRCPPKCPRRRKKKPCGTCASRGRRGDCSKPVTLVHEGTPTLEEDSSGRQDEQDPEKQSVDGDVERQRQGSRSRSNSKGMKGGSGGNRSRSQSLANSRYSGSETNDEENQDDE
ncbi:unnamed protein product [Trichogramma brassicae]|uniref:Uncharacterized protein n=1 Tax=Trichogramma brassicae TaxID=86971 RepID=A0A6H5ICW2_9HYME|nr:unnamed protein product [Trichogramma brassicae]